ncbi:Helix-turn-helix domain protein [Posidoniimonas polymericola]|uniref:Helix-turn-helix domain protein n=1 Tax=Posidoniimonas polymericola TaxID=2528002 RepID=A0A5C5YMX0_9BACT|nr:B12-binding domain-containing protein [Posidoniimonas polymericola]TWT76128.1 Helix-turn-helix domain protein [Posidoniimonas polymericola]
MSGTDLQQLLSPKQIARALDVSESSIKRWCDGGLIRAEHTAGGHRRVPMSELLDFLKRTDRRVVEPAAIGLVAPATVRRPCLAGAVDRFTAAITAGEEATARQIGVELAVARVGMAELCDAVLAPAMHRVGALWETGQVSIYQERRACGIVEQTLVDLQNLCQPPEPDAPLAIGASTAGDYYSLPNDMTRLVLSDLGWRATSLGENIPLASLADAVQSERPKVVWISCSYLTDPPGFLAEFQAFRSQVADRSQIVVGGRALTDEIRKQLHYSAFCDTMAHLQGFVEAIKA